MTHKIIEELNARYTTKHFNRNKKVSNQDLQVIGEALRLTPSSINSQPWKFIIIETDESKRRLHDTFENKFQFNQKHALDASHTILFAHNPKYNRQDFEKVIDQMIADGRVKKENKEQAFNSYAFAELNTNAEGNNSDWTKAQAYIAVGNAIHTLARLGIDSTPMEGIDSSLVAKEFAKELNGYECHVALAIGYRDEESDYNAPLPKSRLNFDDIISKI